jgi:hypothetical protein
MGFMDKAKKLAEQAQQKLDEAQESINQQTSQQGGGEAGGVSYDEHGRPVGQAPPAGATPPPAGEPAPEPPAAEAAPEPPAAESAAPPSAGDANATPDPFKPLQQ